jgi:glycosyltransferase involved in cell wall biosynthesis
MRIDLTIVNTASWGVKKYYFNYAKYLRNDNEIVYSKAKNKLLLHIIFNLKYLLYNRKIHTWFPTGIIPLFATNFSVTIHDIIPLLNKNNFNWIYRLYLQTILKFKLKHAKNVYVVSKTVANNLTDTLGLKRDFIITYNFVNNLNDNWKSFKLDFPQNYFLFVGNFASHKGLNKLLELWEKQSYLLVCVIDKGDSLCRNYGLNPNVVFLDKCDDDSLVSLYSLSSGLLFPSSHEGFGIPGIEANILNRRVIYNNIPVFKEIFSYTHKNICFDFNVENSESLKLILEDLVFDYELNQNLPSYFTSPNNFIVEC